MTRSQLGDYVHDALVSAKKHLDEGNLEAADRDRQNLKSNLQLMQGDPYVNIHLRAVDWGSWESIKNLEDYELIHDSNRPKGDSRESWII